LAQATYASGYSFQWGETQQVICLVDSGADESLFHSSIARNLGIEIETGIYKRFDGIAGTLEAYMHPIDVEVQGFSERVTIEIGFTESEGVDAILGQMGFFDNHTICFDRRRGRMEIASHS